MLRTTSEPSPAPVTPHIQPPPGSSPTLPAPFCPLWTCLLCHSKEGTHRGEENGLSGALLPAQGGPQACSLPDTDTNLHPHRNSRFRHVPCTGASLPRSCQPHGHCHWATGQRRSSFRPCPSHRTLQRTFLLQRCPNPLQRFG